MRVVILFGTEMGTAERAAEAVADVLAASHDVAVYDMSDFDADDLDTRDFHILVCSTYGTGELPTGAEPFFAQLDDRLPDLSGLRFAVFGLGDIVYDTTFNRGGEICAEKFTALGAEQVGAHARHDASSSERPQDMAREWARALEIPAPTSV
ncbi:flavodoxin family protein [Nocardia terpenica]|uniref:Nitric oxide synthase n=1 Tax=Nocardia terpenica TaxID=455432 RepID=A0A164L623_9NOCA|nr:flavodoxin family protein [Nocardia terpenica]KZM72062.1 nitric oxide synthase [Nocardia terpenica]MBF6060608.1 flavodoxin family protein [Nocardia terpenica]MBF6103868.1 flavodoxin family protein [Nocardia terpenica]MBF6111758.1 flavodoxin family protein [Nocardia terpenica]MBF6118089.1 flavodoxin family protein [Nocardia terpenica]